MNTVHALIEPEPPPPQENNTIETIEPEPPPTADETQWIDDVKHIAGENLARIRLCNDAHTDGREYTPFVKTLKGSIRLNAHLLHLQQRTQTKPRMPPPRSHPLHIPTPKSYIHRTVRNILHDTTWKDFECKLESKCNRRLGCTSKFLPTHRRPDPPRT